MDGVVIFDIGANIGLFTLFIKEKFPNSQVYAFEPAPHVYPLLCHNTHSYDDSIKVYPHAITREIKQALFHYYQDFSVIYGFYADQQKDAAVIFQGMDERDKAMPTIKPLIAKRLSQLNSYQCQTSTVSAMIKENQLKQIDLLKMDVEGSELDVLKGIQQFDWDKIKHIRMEVHHSTLLQEITSLLVARNFNILVEPDKKLELAGIYNLIASQKK